MEISLTQNKLYANLSKDFNKIVYILMNEFDAPSSSLKKNWGASFQWNFLNAQLVLISNKNDNHIQLSYLKNM